MPKWSSFDAATDRRLVHGLNEGDDGALALLYESYAERLYDYALSMMGEYKDAADIVHDTFIDACRRAPRMRDHVRLRSWLYGAARRRCVQRGRVRVLFWEPDVDFSEAPYPEAARAPDRTDDASDEGRARRRPDVELPPSTELRGLLEASLARLEIGEQEALLLAVRHGLLPAEIGTVLGVSPRRAAARVARSRSRLDAAYETELMLATERCVAGVRARPAAPERAPEPAPERVAEEKSDGTVVGDASAKQAAAEVPVEETTATGPDDGSRPPRSRQASAVLAQRSPPASRWPACRSRPGGRRPASRTATTKWPGGHHCTECERRSGVYAAALLALAPSPVLPAALRHRVIHTATDSELAGYRADIAARGGGLTPDGLPSQPDMPSPFTRRWLFAGGGMAGALVTAVLGALLMGPGLGSPTIYWPPFQTRPQPSITEQTPEQRNGATPGPQAPPQARAPGSDGRPGAPQRNGSGTPAPSSPAPTSPAAPPPGTLGVSPAKVELYGTKTARVRLTAQEGPVSWNAVASDAEVSVSHPQGGLDENGEMDVTITLRGGLLKLPGEATVTFIDAETGASREVAVVWGASLL
ncbi:sigma-70 family RNA polymerase sigma factor [Actinomadura sp. 9N407]|uniref:sigma-70 family RNA polymerase sigma factor n=1 Tax=Actinomadura sp. 9N407 TaxID=3375154 RepID=UPI0037B95B27